jgi:hypothetical protein
MLTSIEEERVVHEIDPSKDVFDGLMFKEFENGKKANESPVSRG